MRKILASILVFTLLCISAHAVELDKALSRFAAYKHGDAKQVLHETRMAAFLNANDHKTRVKHEKLLLGFVQSDATVAARREACMWLSDLATDASKPVLSELSKQADFADVAQIALDALKKATVVSVDHDLARFKAEITNSKKPDGLIQDAVTGSDIMKARVAFNLIETGALKTSMDDWLVHNILKLDSQKQILAMNVLINSGSPDSAKAVQKVAEKGEGEARVYAVKRLGFSDDGLELLVKMLRGDDKGLSDTALDAILAAPDKALKKHVLKLLKSDDSSLQAAGVYIAKTRGLEYAADALWAITEDSSNPNRGDAVKALGSAAPLSEYTRILDAFIGSAGSPVHGDWKIALKDASFRTADYDKTIVMLAKAKKGAPADLAGTLDALSGKLKQLYGQGTAWTARLSLIETAENNDGKKKICFVAGKDSHGKDTHAHSAGCRLLVSALNKMPGVTAVVSENGWPADSSFFDNAAAVVMFSDGGRRHVGKDHWEEIDNMAKKGVGISVLHYATMVDKGKVGDYFLDWLGGYYEAGWSVNPHWEADFKSFANHPVTRGIKPFKIKDEWYFHMRFRDGMKGVTPVLSAHPPASAMARPDGPHSGNPAVRAAVKNGEIQHVAWVATRPDGGRGFGFTGAHFHKNWQNENFQKLVLNAVAWTAKVEIPADGVPVALKN